MKLLAYSAVALVLGATAMTTALAADDADLIISAEAGAPAAVSSNAAIYAA